MDDAQPRELHANTDASIPPLNEAPASPPEGSFPTRATVTRRPSQSEVHVHAALGLLAAQVGAMRQHLPHVEGLHQCVKAAEQALQDAKQVPDHSATMVLTTGSMSL